MGLENNGCGIQEQILVLYLKHAVVLCEDTYEASFLCSRCFTDKIVNFLRFWIKPWENVLHHHLCPHMGGNLSNIRSQRSDGDQKKGHQMHIGEAMVGQ